ncbi:hypothetical protein AB0D32_23665 [Micromonospora sp. NPDC048170]|uniref:hypothetical protein n=1 Tax=Micromonospora sp. NPDC048170 TaxID=3154819 RepID=UPI003409AD91
MGEIVISSATTGLQHQPAVAGLSFQHFLVVWADSNDATIKGRILRADGTPLDDEFSVNTPTPDTPNTDRQWPAVANAGSGLAVVWIEQPFNPPGPPVPQVKLQRFDPDGQKIGNEIRVSTGDIDPGQRPAITGMIDGGYLVVWLGRSSEQRIRARRFGPDVTPIGEEFDVPQAAGAHLDPTVTRLAGGDTVIAWRNDPAQVGGGALVFRLFDLQGIPRSDELRPNLFGFVGGMATTVVDDGFAVAHLRAGSPSDLGLPTSSVEAHLFNADGSDRNVPMGISGAGGIACKPPALSALPGGRFLTAWIQASAETFSTSPSVIAKVMSATQGSINGEIQLNETTVGDRRSARVATVLDEAGTGQRALVVWAECLEISGGIRFEVHGRPFRIDPDGTPAL